MKKLDKTSEHFRKNEVAALIEMSKMYTEKDLCEFSEWCSKNFWHYVEQKNGWININKSENKTTSQLIEQWEIETGRRKE